MKLISIRFYEELNDFLPKQKRKIRFVHEFMGQPSIKDLVESLGIPHTEVDLIMANGQSVDFNYIINDGDDISVYPVFEAMDIINLQHLRPKPLRRPKFVLDVHLGTLAKYMRLLGYDAKYRNDFDDSEIIRISLEEKRTILTRDLGILKHRDVTHGYWIHSTKTENQLTEVIKRFDLTGQIKEFTRCLECNSLIEAVSKDSVIEKLPPSIIKYQEEFYICASCDKVYWKGSHFKRMNKIIERIKKGR